MGYRSSSAALASRAGLYAACALAACTPFKGSDEPAANAGSDAGGDTVAGNFGTGEVGGFCAKYPAAIQCFDFDGPDATSGLLVEHRGSGAVSSDPAFSDGSPAKALAVLVLDMQDRATATPAAIDLGLHPGATLAIEFMFRTATAPKTVEYIARLNFNNESAPIALDSAGGLECATTTFPLIATGVHLVSLTVQVDGTGKGVSFTCSLDASQTMKSTLNAATSLTVELGNVNAGGKGSFAVTYDNFLVQAL